MLNYSAISSRLYWRRRKVLYFFKKRTSGKPHPSPDSVKTYHDKGKGGVTRLSINLRSPCRKAGRLSTFD